MTVLQLPVLNLLFLDEEFLHGQILIILRCGLFCWIMTLRILILPFLGKYIGRCLLPGLILLSRIQM